MSTMPVTTNAAPANRQLTGCSSARERIQLGCSLTKAANLSATLSALNTKGIPNAINTTPVAVVVTVTE